MKKIRLLEIIHEEITSALTEIPDFGGRYDSQVADKHGEEDTLQAATDEIVDETLKDMNVTKADLKKDAKTAKEVLKVIRKKVVGKNQDPRVKDALEKQEEWDDSANLLQANQANNAILKALGLKEPSKRGRKAIEKKEETSTKPESKTKAEDIQLSDEEKEAEAAAGTETEIGKKAERLAQVQKFTNRMKDEGIVGSDGKILDTKKYKEEFAKVKAKLKEELN